MRTVKLDKEEQPAYLPPYARAVKRHAASDYRARLWASRRTQALRFDALLRMANPAGLSMLDLGCGAGDLLDFLIARNAAPDRYIGIEGVAELADAADAKRHANATILRTDFVAEPIHLVVADADIIYCSGALNTIDAGDFYQIIGHAFAAAKRAFVFNFLCSPLLAGMSYLHWHNRRDVLAFARSLRARVQVDEGYIQGDCTIGLGKAWAA